MTARDRRALRRGGAVILAAVLLLRVLPALARHYAAVRVGATERLATLVRARSLLAAAPAVTDSFAVAARQLVGLAPELVDGETAADAAAALTAELSLIANRAGLRVTSLNALPNSTRGTFVPVLLSGQLEGDIGGLAGFLRAVEGGRMVLSLRSLNVMAADPLEQQPGAEQLRLEVVIAGWRLNRHSP